MKAFAADREIAHPALLSPRYAAATSEPCLTVLVDRFDVLRYDSRLTISWLLTSIVRAPSV